MNLVRLLTAALVALTSIQSFCLVANGREPEMELFDTAFATWNQYVPFCQRLVFFDTGQCKPGVRDTIELGPVNGTAGFTRTTTSTRGVVRDIFLDTDQLPTAALFYNVLLHELGHALGLGHPVQRTAPTAMGYTLRFDGRSFVSDKYIAIGLDDVIALRRAYQLPPGWLFESRIPSLPPGSAACGQV